MSETVWTVPTLVLDREAIKAWCIEQGINPFNVAEDGFHITREPDGSLVARGNEYILDETGARTLDPTGKRFRQTPKTWPVTSIPETSA